MNLLDKLSAIRSSSFVKIRTKESRYTFGLGSVLGLSLTTGFSEVKTGLSEVKTGLFPEVISDSTAVFETGSLTRQPQE